MRPWPQLTPGAFFMPTPQPRSHPWKSNFTNPPWRGTYKRWTQERREREARERECPEERAALDAQLEAIRNG